MTETAPLESPPVTDLSTAATPDAAPETPKARWDRITSDPRWMDPLSEGALTTDDKVHVLELETMNRAAAARQFEGDDYDLAMGMVDEWYKKQRVRLEQKREQADAFVARGKPTPGDQLVGTAKKFLAGTARALAPIHTDLAIGLRQGVEKLGLQQNPLAVGFAEFAAEYARQEAVEIPDALHQSIDPRIRNRTSKVGQTIDTTVEALPQIGMTIGIGVASEGMGWIAKNSTMGRKLATVAPFLYAASAEGQDAYYETVAKLTEQGMALDQVEAEAVKAWVEQGSVNGVFEAAVPVMFLKHLDQASGGTLRKALASKLLTAGATVTRDTIAEGFTEWLQESWGQNVARRYFIDPNLNQEEREALLTQWKTARAVASGSGSLMGFLLGAVEARAGIKGKVHVATDEKTGKLRANLDGLTDLENRLDLDAVAKNGGPITESFITDDPRWRAAKSQAEADTVRQVIAFERAFQGQQGATVEFNLHDEERSLQDEIQNGTLSEEDAWHRINNADGLSGKIASPADARVFGRNSVEFRDQVFRQVIDLYQGATPEDVAHEMAEAWFKTGIASGRLDLNDFVRLKNQHETDTNTDHKSDDIVGVTEWFSGRAVEYLTHRTRTGENVSPTTQSFSAWLDNVAGKPDAGTAAESVPFLHRARLALAHTLRRARQLLAMVRGGKIDANFETILQEATGLSLANLQAPATQHEAALDRATAAPPKTRDQAEKALFAEQKRINESLDIKPPRDPGLSQSEQADLQALVEQLTEPEKAQLRDLINTPAEQRFQKLQAQPVSNRVLHAFDALVPDATDIQGELLQRVYREDMGTAAGQSQVVSLNEAVRQIGGLLAPARAQEADHPLASDMGQLNPEPGRFKNTGLSYEDAVAALREYGFDFADPAGLMDALQRSDLGQAVTGTRADTVLPVTFSLADGQPIAPDVPFGRLSVALSQEIVHGQTGISLSFEPGNGTNVAQNKARSRKQMGLLPTSEVAVRAQNDLPEVERTARASIGFLPAAKAERIMTLVRTAATTLRRGEDPQFSRNTAGDEPVFASLDKYVFDLAVADRRTGNLVENQIIEGLLSREGFHDGPDERAEAVWDTLREWVANGQNRRFELTSLDSKEQAIAERLHGEFNAIVSNVATLARTASEAHFGTLDDWAAPIEARIEERVAALDEDLSEDAYQAEEERIREEEWKKTTYAIRSELDPRYLDLAKDPQKNLGKLQALVDEAAHRAGYTVGPVWHGSPNPDFEAFDTALIGSYTDEGRAGPGFYFTDRRDVAERYGAARRFWLQMTSADGSISADKSFEGAQEYVVRQPNQIKLADPITRDSAGKIIPLSQRFNPATNLVTYALHETTTPTERAWLDLDRVGPAPSAADLARRVDEFRLPVTDSNPLNPDAPRTLTIGRPAKGVAADAATLATVQARTDGRLLSVDAIERGKLEVSDPLVLWSRLLNYAAAHGFRGIALDPALVGADEPALSAYAQVLGGALSYGQDGRVHVEVGSAVAASAAGLSPDPVPVTYNLGPNRYQIAWNETRKLVEDWRKTDPIGTAENEFKSGDEYRGYARYLDAYYKKLPAHLQDFWALISAKDFETGETLTVFEDGVHGGHVWNVIEAAQALNVPETYHIGRQTDELIPEAVSRKTRQAEASRRKLKEFRDGFVWNFENAKYKEADGRRQLVMDLRLLEQIIATLPFEIRAQVGGFSQLARLVRLPTRQRYLLGRLAQVEEVLNKYTRELHLGNIETILAKAQTKIAGTERITEGKAKGRLRAVDMEGNRKEMGTLGGEGHRLFGLVAQAIPMHEDQVERRMTELQPVADLDETAQAEWDILDHVGALRSLDVESLARAQTFLENLFTTFRTRRQELEAARKARWAEARVDLRNATGKPSPNQNEIEKAAKDSQTTLKGGADSWMRQKLDLPQFLERMFPGSTWARRLSDRLRAAVNQVTDAVLVHHSKFYDYAERVFGVKTRRAVNHKMWERLQVQQDTGVFYNSILPKTESISLEEAAAIASGQDTSQTEPRAAVIRAAYAAHQQEGIRLEAEARQAAAAKAAERAGRQAPVPADPAERTNGITQIHFDQGQKLEGGSLIAAGFRTYPGKNAVITDPAVQKAADAFVSTQDNRAVGWNGSAETGPRLYYKGNQAFILYLAHKPGDPEIDGRLFPVELQGGFSLDTSPAGLESAPEVATSRALANWRRRTKLTVEFPGSEPVEQHLSQMEAAYHWLLLEQPEYGNRADKLGFLPESKAQLEAFLDPETKLLARYMQREAGDMWHKINPVYERLNGTNLARVDKYFTAHFHTKANEDSKVDPFTQEHLASGFEDSFTKRRVIHNQRPRRLSAFHVFWGHMQMAEHYVAFAEIAKDMKATLAPDEVAHSVVAAHGQENLNSLGNWIQLVEKGGTISQEINLAEYKVVGWMASNLARAALAWKATSTLVQTSNLFSTLAEIPAPAWIASATRLAFSGRLWSTVAEIYHSPDIQRRLETGLSPEMRMLLSPSNPRKSGWMEALSDAGLDLIGKSDAGALAVSSAIAYEHGRNEAAKAGLTGEELHQAGLKAASDVILRVQQPTDFVNKSLTENVKNPVMKLGLLMFLSDPRRKSANLYMAGFRAAEAMKANPGLGTALSSLSPVARLALLYFGLMPFWESLARGLAGVVFGGKKPDDAWNLKEILANMAAGPLTGLPLAGPVWEYAIRKSMGLRSFSKNPLIDTVLGSAEAARSDAKRIAKAIEDGAYAAAVGYLGKEVNHIGAATWGSLGSIGNLIFQGANAVRFASTFRPLTPEEAGLKMVEEMEREEAEEKKEHKAPPFQANLKPIEKTISKLGVTDGRRAQAIAAYLQGFVKKEEWPQLLTKWQTLEYQRGAKLISRDVRKQLEQEHGFTFPNPAAKRGKTPKSEGYLLRPDPTQKVAPAAPERPYILRPGPN